MISPSATSPTMEDQVKREFAVTNKFNPNFHPIYPSSSSNPNFSDHPPTPTTTGGSPNCTGESSAAPVTYQESGQIENDEVDDFINYNHDDEQDEYDEDAYFNSFPPGYRFKPHDEELVVYYLKRKIFNQSLPRNRIKEVELYKYNPDTLAAKYKSNGEDEWYFFTPRDRKYPNGERPNRAAGDGFWKATGADKPIRFNEKRVGLKKSLVFYKGKPPKGDKTDWIMHEYKLIDAPKRRKISQHDMKLDDWVLCKIRKKDKKDKSDKSDKIVKPVASDLQSHSSDASPSQEIVQVSPPQETVQVPPPSCTPIITSGENENYSNYNRISESLHSIFEQEQPVLYAQHMNSGLGVHNNFGPWIDNMASPRISFTHSIQPTPYDYLIHVPPIQRLDNLSFNITAELDQLLHSVTEEKDGKNF